MDAFLVGSRVTGVLFFGHPPDRCASEGRDTVEMSMVRAIVATLALMTRKMASRVAKVIDEPILGRRTLPRPDALVQGVCAWADPPG